jgi:hypothetical protein
MEVALIGRYYVAHPAPIAQPLSVMTGQDRIVASEAYDTTASAVGNSGRILARVGRILYSLCLALTVCYDLEQGSSLGTRDYESIS